MPLPLPDDVLRAIVAIACDAHPPSRVAGALVNVLALGASLWTVVLSYGVSTLLLEIYALVAGRRRRP